ncbi:MAG: phosphoserine phosphatase SerB [Pseudomonadota bacterium]
MFVATLIAPAGTLPTALPDALRNALGGGDVVWLSPGRAAEFSIDVVPDHADSLQADLQDQAVDLAFLPAKNRRKRLLIADMDSTMIEQECIDELAAETGIGSGVSEITARAMNGELDFEAALTERVELLKGFPENLIDRVVQTRITYTPGGAALLATMKAQGAYAALVSGGFTAFTEAVAAHLGFDENRANSLITENGVITGRVGQPILGRDAKVTALNDIARQLGITAEDAIAVGDGANDLGMLGAAGMGVALHAKPSVQEQAEIVINNGDLTALLYLQGYSDADIVGA